MPGPFVDAFLEFVIEMLEFGLGSLERGGLDNLPIPVSPGEDKLVRPHDIQDLRSAAPRKGVRAQHREALIADHFVETIFVVTEVTPVLPCQPGRIPGHSHAGVTSGGYARELFIPAACQSLAIERATREKPVPRRHDF